MPKLPSDAAKKADDAAKASGFTQIPAGDYQARLIEVTAKQASTGNPMWVWVYEITDDEYSGRRMWVNTVLTDKAMWKVAEQFAAFDVPTDTDTDELIGRPVTLTIVETTITGGARAGQPGNDVSFTGPPEGGNTAPASVGSGEAAAASDGAASW